MDVKRIFRHHLFLTFFLCCVNGETSEPFFLVTFPAVIQSGSEAKLCASVLKPRDGLMDIHLVGNDNQTTLLLQKRTDEEMHRCCNFQAPHIDGQSVQKIRVEVQGRSFKLAEERKVMFRSYYPLTFIQTDKPIYTPGQMVHFRAVTMDGSFVPLDQMYSMVVVEDSQSNRIGQWTNVSSIGWILQLSHELNPEARQGMYTLKAYIGERMVVHNFEVKKYVLPKFDVTIKAAKTHSVGEEELKIEVCGKYTYNQPVLGSAWVEVCRNSFKYVSVPGVVSPCLNQIAEMNKTGCASYMFDTSAFINFRFENYLQDSLVVQANLTEEGTGTVMTKSQTVSLTYEIGKVTFVDLPNTFEHGSVLEGEIKVVHFNGTPIDDKAVYLLEGQSWASKVLQNLTTDSNGLAAFSLNTDSLPNSDFNLMASVSPELLYTYKKPYFTTDQKTIRLLQPATSYTPTFSELTIEKIEQPLMCDTEITVTIKYHFVGETASNINTAVIYMVLSRGVIVHHGYKNVNVQTSNGAASGSVSFKLFVGEDLSPAVQILAYCLLPSNNVVAGSTVFDIEKCFKNKVSVQFSPASAAPGEENTIELSAHPGSLCGVSAVDQSLFILESGKRLNAEKIFGLLPVQSVSVYPYEVEDEQECLKRRPRRAVLPPRVVPTNSPYETFKGVGLKVASNLALRDPQCLEYRGHNYYRHDVHYPRYPGIRPMAAPLAMAVPLAEGAGLGEVNSAIEVTVRTVFPETWIWELVEVGDSGSTEVPVKVPDTITTWEADVFCLSSEGLGLAPPAQLTVFQPFFLELSLPYSIIRGEIFELKATVFNYLSACIMVQVTPAPSSDFTLRPLTGSPYSTCLCVNGRKTFSWVLTPLALGVMNVTISAQALSQGTCGKIVSVPESGRVDIVTRSLRVLAEGVERTTTYSWLLCPRGSRISEEVMLTLPPNVIRGSARSSISVLGDILGRALQNLQGLLLMPYGCGEQNIAVLSPNIYILQYLENTEQLTSNIREKAIGFLKSGYQRQLNYRHPDGAFSAFGYGDGNTWLTAFVMRSFGQAQKYIFIDPHVIQSAKDWLIRGQSSDGCFVQQGKSFNNRMGGVNDNVTMTAYITASLLELETPVTDPVVTQALSCLRSINGDLKNTYTIALLAYTFSLARDEDTLWQLLNELDTLAISDGGLLHWTQMGSTVYSGSLAVEISSYVLLAVLTTDSVTTADLGYANRIVSWLVKQHNAYGGFSSTQDTVVALQALSLYATKVFSSDGSSTVTVQSAGDSHSFDVDQDNKLLYQEEQLQNVPGRYTIGVTGSTCVSVQVTLFYNIPTPAQITKTLSVEAKLTGDCLVSSGPNLIMNFFVKYNGPQESTNMVIVDIKLLSGFTADTTTLGTPPNSYAPLVERVDSEAGRVIVYLKEVPKNIPMSYKLQMKQLYPVKSLRSAVIKVYDYYQPSDQSETAYSSPCA
ncbi:alpha-2-macroglobulin-like [Triplophysa rosa]|uniref:Alpha-2-macroglobulin-like n=1 Tax=Triplophysa rosa TaxID=992332 RepID=A0A9W7TRT3_TRIRA|nr:alpha-2-macroglobulin-like [Triplophysa rosa]XP_057201194.1 alpha-2-macroglobulin-like [Triplophysa rosa]KAI7804148.1 putative alpha-2-macroglobulin-like [Triplophysa rosa]